MTGSKRRKIGVIATDPENIYQAKVLEGIFRQASELGYDVLVFSTFVKETHPSEGYLMGETNIYNIINFDLLDGVIVLTQYLKYGSEGALFSQITELFGKKCHCPVISVDETLGDCDVVSTDDVTAFEKITDHVIEEHGCRKIYILAGDRETSAAQMRLKGFRNSLKAHGIEPEEKNVFYGEFWYTLGERIAARLALGEIEMPDAVVAASDYIGLGFVNECIRRGIRIPEDLIVTGFDGVIESRANVVSLTSYIPPVNQTGAEAVVKLAEKIENSHVECCMNSYGEVVCGMSCGCRITSTGKRERDDYGYIATYTSPEIDMVKFLQSYMAEALTESGSMEECMDRIMKNAYLVDNCCEYFLCTCDDWENDDSSFYGNRCGYTDRMKISIYRCIPEFFGEWPDMKEMKGTRDPYLNTYFSSSEMLPKIFEEKREVPAVFYFTPSHFNGRRIGYSVMRFRPENAVINFIYQQWSRYVNNALEMMRVRSLLLLKSARDVMTGLYNRNSYKGHMEEQLKLSVKNGTQLFVAFVDMNSLKYINDVYGHDAGDGAIITLAGIISSVCADDSVCMRLGGDEFLIVGQSSNAEENLKLKTQSIISRLDSYNENSDRPYRVTASFGYDWGMVKTVGEAEELVKSADEKMYVYKTEFKKNNKPEKECR